MVSGMGSPTVCENGVAFGCSTGNDWLKQFEGKKIRIFVEVLED